MKVKPVILCGGSGTRLFPNFKKNPSKQFIDFGGWTLFQKTLERVKSPIFDYPIISTNIEYKNLIINELKKQKIKNYKIILEPVKKNTAPAFISSTLIDDIKINQPIIFLPSDHYIPDKNKFNKVLQKNVSYLTAKNIFLFGIKPNSPRSDYGYLSINHKDKSINKVIKFIEKPKKDKAISIIKKGGLWNSGIVFARKDSIINNSKLLQKKLFNDCLLSLNKVDQRKKIFTLNKTVFKKITPISFDYAILEKANEINSIELNTKWSDLGSWLEIFKVIKDKTNKNFILKNTFFRPCGNYINYFKGKSFLIKELTINKKSSISLQKHHHRSELWTVTNGKPKITLGKKTFFKKINETIFVPKGTIHRIENLYKEPVKIVEAQLGNILKETDIVRYQDIYGRVN